MRVLLLAVSMSLVLGTGISAARDQMTPSVRGTITDQLGAVMVGVPIELEGRDDQIWTAESDDRGAYVFESVPPGQYRIRVAAPGFVVFSARVRVRPNAASVLDVSLKINVSVSIEVTDQQGLSTDPRRSLSALILTGRQIEELPDDPDQLIRRLLEMAGSSGRRGDVAIYVDGFREYRRLPPKGSIQMIRINSNSFSAEFSQQSAKRIEITTKVGTGTYHGDATLAGRPASLEARNPLADKDPVGRYLSYNGSIQGPVVKDRAGFYAYVGRWQLDDNAQVNASVINPGTGLATPFKATVAVPATMTSALIKADFTVFKQVFNVWYSRTDDARRNQGLEGGFDLPEHGFDRTMTDDVGRMWWTWIGKRSVNEVRLEVKQSRAESRAFTAGPTIRVLDAFNGGGNQYAATRSTNGGLQASDTFTLAVKKHTMKVGIQLDQVDRLRSVDRTGFGGTFTFGADVERDASGLPILDAEGDTTSIAPIEAYRRTLNGVAGYGPSQFSLVVGNPQVNLTQWNGGWFILDDWSVSKRVALSYGVRQELQNNVEFHANLAPRAALSLQLDRRGRQSLKLGGGIFYSAVDAAVTLETLRSDGRRRQQMVIQNPAFFPVVPASLSGAVSSTQVIYTKARQLRDPYSLIMSATYERDLWPGVSGSAEYAYSKGFAMLRLRDLSGAGIATGSQQLQFESTGRSVEHQITLGVSGQLGQKGSYYAQYRLGGKKSDTDGAYSVPADSRDLSADYGFADDDQRHLFVWGTSLTLPGRVRASVGYSIGSGRPFDIRTGRDDNRDTFFLDRPSFARPGDPDAIETPYGLLNPSPAPGDPVIPRNLGREPWQSSLNLSLSRSVKRLSCTLSIDNLLNTARLLAVNGYLTSPVFGRPNRALGPRRVSLSVGYGF